MYVSWCRARSGLLSFSLDFSHSSYVVGALGNSFQIQRCHFYSKPFVSSLRPHALYSFIFSFALSCRAVFFSLLLCMIPSAEYRHDGTRSGAALYDLRKGRSTRFEKRKTYRMQREKRDEQRYSGIPVVVPSSSFARSVQRSASKECTIIFLRAQKFLVSTSSAVPSPLYASREMMRPLEVPCGWKVKRVLACQNACKLSYHPACSLCACIRFVSSPSSSFSESESFSTPQELFHFFNRYKMWRSKEPSQKKKITSEKESSNGSTGNAEAPSEEALRRALDRFLSWPASPDGKTLPLVKLACEAAFAAGWTQRSCEMFFSSFPTELLERYVARLLQDQGGRSPIFSAHSTETSISTASSDDAEEKKVDRKNSFVVGNESIEARTMSTTASTYPIPPGVEVESDGTQLSMFIDLLASLPSEVLQSAIQFFQVEELLPSGVQGNPKLYREGMVVIPSLTHDAVTASSLFSYSSARYIYQCLVVAHLLTSQSASTTVHGSGECHNGSRGQEGTLATSPTFSVVPLRANSDEKGSQMERIVGSGKTIALRMYVYALWEIVRGEKVGLQRKFRASHLYSASAVKGKETSESSIHERRNHDEREKHRVHFLRHVAKVAAAIFGIQQHGWSSSAIARGFEGFLHASQENDVSDCSLLDEEEDVLETSLRLLRYRWSAFVVPNTLSITESSILLDDGKRSLTCGKASSTVLPFSYSEFPSPQEEEKILSDSLASLCVHLLRVYVKQEGVTAVMGRKRRVSTEELLQRERSPRSAVHMNDSGTHPTEKQEQSQIVVHMNPEVSCFLLKVIIASHRWDLGDYLTLLLDQYWHSRFENGKGNDCASALLSHSAIITKSEENLLHHQARYYMLSRQFLRALEWWSWIGSLGSACATVVTDRNGSVSVIPPSARSNALSLPFYPIPNIPLLATLARIAGEFATMNDYYISLRSSSPQRSSTSYLQRHFRQGGAENKVRFHDPATLALWCLETMLHSQQPSPPTGNALFLAVTACAKSGLPVLEQVLQSLVENQVLALTEEEVLHVRLLQCRRDIHWRERLEAFVPFVLQMPALPVPLSSTASRRSAGEHIEFSPSPEAFPLPHLSSTKIKKDLFMKPRNPFQEGQQSSVLANSSTVYGAANTASVDSTFTMPSHSLFFSLPIQGIIDAFSDAGLSARNVFRILLLLQEGNDSRFLPFYLYVRHIFALSSPSSFPSSPSTSSVYPLSRDQECRWLLLALTYTAANAKAVPKEWVWRVAAEALRHLQNGLRSHAHKKTFFNADEVGEESHGEWIQENDADYEAHVEKGEKGVKKNNKDSSGPSLLSSTSRSSDAHANHYPFIHSSSSFTSLAPDTWKSLQRKWTTFRNQYSEAFWVSFLEAFTKKNSIQDSSGKVRSITHVGATIPPEAFIRQEEDAVQVEWEHLLQLPSFTLLPRTCRTYLHVEREANDPSSRRSRKKESATDASPTAMQSVDEGFRFLTKKGKLYHLPLRGCFPDADMMFEQATHYVSSTSRGDARQSAAFLLRHEWQSNWLS